MVRQRSAKHVRLSNQDRSEDPNTIEKLRISTEKAKLLYETFHKGGYTGLVIASHYDPLELITILKPYLAGSSPIVVYSPRKEVDF